MKCNALPHCRTSLMLLLAFFLAGCSWFSGPVVSVPVQANAAQQYRYAVEQRKQMSLELITKPKKLAEARLVVRKEFEAVSKNFPDDRKFTPLAKLEVIEMEAGFDHRKIHPSSGELHDAIKQFAALAKLYPEYDFIQAKAMYDQGTCHRLLSEFPQAQDCFKQVRDRFARHPDKVISDLAAMAGQYYNEVYVNR